MPPEGHWFLRFFALRFSAREDDFLSWICSSSVRFSVRPTLLFYFNEFLGKSSLCVGIASRLWVLFALRCQWSRLFAVCSTLFHCKRFTQKSPGMSHCRGRRWSDNGCCFLGPFLFHLRLSLPIRHWKGSAFWTLQGTGEEFNFKIKNTTKPNLKNNLDSFI